MGKCRYCGRSAGLFKDEHDTCANLHQATLKGIPARVGLSISLFLDMEDADAAARLDAAAGFIQEHELPRLYVLGWENALDIFLESGPLDAEQVTRLLSAFSEMPDAQRALLESAKFKELLNAKPTGDHQ